MVARKHIFPALIVAAMLLVGLFALGRPASANPGGPGNGGATPVERGQQAPGAVGVLDCSSDGISWTEWKYVGFDARAAGKICGSPSVESSRVRTWDRRSDGQCASIFFQINQGATVYYGGTTSCGNGIVSAGWTPSYPVWAVFVASHPTGQNTWSAVTDARELCWPSNGC